MLGKLSWNAIPFDQPIPLISGAVVMLIVLGILLWVIAKGWLPYLWKEWITSASASCTYCSVWSCWCAASSMH
jgi:cytochrome o ubiquinol oxidase subunit 1